MSLIDDTTVQGQRFPWFSQAAFCLLIGTLYKGFVIFLLQLLDLPRRSEAFSGRCVFRGVMLIGGCLPIASAKLLHSVRTCSGIPSASTHLLHRGLSVVPKVNRSLFSSQDTKDLPDIVPFQSNQVSAQSYASMYSQNHFLK